MNPRLVWLDTYKENGRGTLTTLEEETVGLPFKPKRMFYIYDVPKNTVRGGHGHKYCDMLMIAVKGIITVDFNGENFVLDRSDLGLYIPAGNVNTFTFVSEDAILLVLASEIYDEDDYIYASDDMKMEMVL